jgi:hypothetical protein
VTRIFFRKDARAIARSSSLSPLFFFFLLCPLFDANTTNFGEHIVHSLASIDRRPIRTLARTNKNDLSLFSK